MGEGNFIELASTYAKKAKDKRKTCVDRVYKQQSNFPTKARKLFGLEVK